MGGGTTIRATSHARILADDAVFFRQTLATACDPPGSTSSVRLARPGALALVESGQPDVAVIDIRMPPTYASEGLAAAARIRTDHPRVGLLILSNAIETRHALELLRDSPQGVGYLLKDRVGDLTEFVDAVRRVGSRGSVVDPEVVATLLGRPRAAGVLDELTKRERDVLGLMAEGRSNQAIGARPV